MSCAVKNIAPATHELNFIRRVPEDKRRVLLQVVFDMVVRSQQEGGALAGAMLWNAAISDNWDSDGWVMLHDP